MRRVVERYYQISYHFAWTRRTCDYRPYAPNGKVISDPTSLSDAQLVTTVPVHIVSFAHSCSHAQTPLSNRSFQPDTIHAVNTTLAPSAIHAVDATIAVSTSIAGDTAIAADTITGVDAASTVDEIVGRDAAG